MFFLRSERPVQLRRLLVLNRVYTRPVRVDLRGGGTNQTLVEGSKSMLKRWMINQLDHVLSTLLIVNAMKESRIAIPFNHQTRDV